MNKQTADFLLEWLKSQKKIEEARNEGLANTSHAAVYWMKQAQWKVVDEIDRQIGVLEKYIK